MIDREMLELAAKAAGIAIARCRLDDPMWRNMLLLPESDGEGVGWNPLTDDGDALRLAVRLGFVVNCWLDAKTTWAGREADVDVDVYWHIEPHGTDPLAATRKAIVHAAASIGEDMTPCTTLAAPVLTPMSLELLRALMEDNGYSSASLKEQADFINGIRHAELAHCATGPTASQEPLMTMDEMNKPHVHHDFIVLWAKGVQLEMYNSDRDTWESINHPSWRSNSVYREKPKPVSGPKPDRIIYVRALVSQGVDLNFSLGTALALFGDNLRLTFDGGTSKLKHAEVVTCLPTN